MIWNVALWTYHQLRDALRLARDDEWSILAIGVFAGVISFTSTSIAMLIDPTNGIDIKVNFVWSFYIGCAVIILAAPGFYTKRRSPLAELIGAAVFGTSAFLIAKYLLGFYILTDYVEGTMVFGLPGAVLGAFTVARPLMAFLHRWRQSPDLPTDVPVSAPGSTPER